METFARRTGWITMVVLAVLLVLASSRYFFPGMPGAFQPEIYSGQKLQILGHILGGMVAVLAGPMQFWSGFRNRFRQIHKFTGLTYIAGVTLGSLLALTLVPTTVGGTTTHFGFGMLAVLWISTTLYAYWTIRQKNWRLHREWMVRSYALTLAFVALRIWFPVLEMLGASNLEAYQTAAWMCWVPNLLIAELYLTWYRGRRTAAV